MREQNKKSTGINNKPFDFILFITVLVLLAMGIIMVLSASSPSALAESRKQLFICNKASNFCSFRYWTNDNNF